MMVAAAVQETVTPEEIEGTSFPDAEVGYDRLHVDAFVKAMADQLRRLQRELDVALERGEAPYRAAGKEIGDLIQNAKDQAAGLIGEAEDEAQRIMKETHHEVMMLRQEADALHKQALKVQQEAERARDRIVSDAQAKAAALVERATSLKHRFEAEGRVVLQEAERDVRRLTQEAKREAKKETDKARAVVEREHAELASRLERRIRALRKAEVTLTRRVATLKNDHDSASAGVSTGDGGGEELGGRSISPVPSKPTGRP